jgi:hypothetical protein
MLGIGEETAVATALYIPHGPQTVNENNPTSCTLCRRLFLARDQHAQPSVGAGLATFLLHRRSVSLVERNRIRSAA